MLDSLGSRCFAYRPDLLSKSRGSRRVSQTQTKKWQSTTYHDQRFPTNLGRTRFNRDFILAEVLLIGFTDTFWKVPEKVSNPLFLKIVLQIICKMLQTYSCGTTRVKYCMHPKTIFWTSEPRLQYLWCLSVGVLMSGDPQIYYIKISNCQVTFIIAHHTQRRSAVVMSKRSTKSLDVAHWDFSRDTSFWAKLDNTSAHIPVLARRGPVPSRWCL